MECAQQLTARQCVSVVKGLVEIPAQLVSNRAKLIMFCVFVSNRAKLIMYRVLC